MPEGIPAEVLGPLGLTAFLVIVVVIGARYVAGFVKEVILDLRKERDEARVDARESDAAVVKLAESHKELVAEIRQITSGIRDGTVTIRRTTRR
jgi:hypothetical protein